MFGSRTGRVVVAVMAMVMATAPAADAQQWSWPERPENLQVLPEDWTGQRLQPVMTGFTRALGVRCSHCHVGEEGHPLSTYDFPSDDNPNKERARTMLRMLGDINETITGSTRRPITIEEGEWVNRPLRLPLLRGPEPEAPGPGSAFESSSRSLQ